MTIVTRRIRGLRSPLVTQNCCVTGHKRGGSFAAAALAALSAFLFTLVLGSAPALHEYFHADAGDPRHECAITVAEAGSELVESGPATSLPRPAVGFCKLPSLSPVWVPALHSCARVFEHAPPALS